MNHLTLAFLLEPLPSEDESISKSLVSFQGLWWPHLQPFNVPLHLLCPLVFSTFRKCYSYLVYIYIFLSTLWINNIHMGIILYNLHSAYLITFIQSICHFFDRMDFLFMFLCSPLEARRLYRGCGQLVSTKHWAHHGADFGVYCRLELLFQPIVSITFLWLSC